jgi:GDP-4-dehydro-6-deoxy-D-mannose reductase
MVLGGLGFLGRHLVQNLQQNGIAVTALARQSPPGSSCIAMGEAPWSASRLVQAIDAAQPDAIFNLVGSSAGSAEHLQQLNVGLTDTVMQAIVDSQKTPLLVVCGSAAEYGASIVSGIPVCEDADCNPVSTYGATKLAQTKATIAFGKATGIRVLIARIFNPIGPGMPAYLALAEFAKQIAASRAAVTVLQTGNIDVCRDFIDVKHVTTALITLAENPEAQGIVNICSGAATSLRRLVGMLIAASAKSVMIETSPCRVRAHEIPVVVGSTKRLARLGAALPPVDFEDNLKRIWRDAALRWAVSL